MSSSTKEPSIWDRAARLVKQIRELEDILEQHRQATVWCRQLKTALCERLDRIAQELRTTRPPST